VVTVGGASGAIHRRLILMPHRVYLVAMWILCGELRELYAPWTGADEVPLMAATLDLVREVVILARWRDWDRPGPIWVNQELAEELVESSPMGQTLEMFYRVVTRVPRLVSADWDPVRIRAEIFGER
jgi:hypothetical protein